MQVRDGMSKVVLSIGPAHTLREAASLMTKRKVGSAVVLDPDRSGIGILTERDILDAIGSGQIPTPSSRRRTSPVISSSLRRPGHSSKPPRR